MQTDKTFRRLDARGPLLTDLRYRAGSIAYVDVIVAQSELIRSRLALIEQDRLAASSKVALFRALGGGWLPQVEAARSLSAVSR